MTRLLQREGRAQRGDGKIGAVIALIVVVAIVYLLFKIVPVRVTQSEMAEEVERAAREFTVNNIDQDAMVQRIVVAAKEHGIALGEQAVQLQEGRSQVDVTLTYDVTLDMIWGPFNHTVRIEKSVPRL